ncbi:hypothetical protein [Nonomuraea jabiensis]|uniref:hypothetical protein n=1 Tax=Nonomuraea jabiensis TaxID=882448 RepID=UPI003684132D
MPTRSAIARAVLRPAAAAVVLTAVVTPAMPTSAHAAGRRLASSATTLMSCTAVIPQSTPLTFEPPVTLRSRTTTAQGTVLLSECTSSDRALAKVRSGVSRITARADASCGAVRNLRARSTVTWYDAGRRKVGTSVVTMTQDSSARFSPGETLMGGTVTQGLLAGARVHGSATPTGRMTSCALQSVRSVYGAGRVWADR